MIPGATSLQLQYLNILGVWPVCTCRYCRRRISHSPICADCEESLEEGIRPCNIGRKVRKMRLKKMCEDTKLFLGQVAKL